ncbi:hypothetical protein ACVDG3_18210 [Meridianimarinicoccus sp. RP-17]|uniref:hypothetical protein n=1 Tax=Meridianimarinicoccus zhengii TaxID=2056810 RepID=UPI000DAC633E|nr:hypothetical protein [Phycocomes zhengii]
MPSTDKMVRAEVRRLARKGKLIDEAFKVFQRSVYPGAPADQVACMRTCFFAGAAEIWALMNAGADEGDDVTDGDMEFMSSWVAEIERFHQRTIDTMNAATRQH